VLTGTGSAGDPYVITSQFDATASIHLTQTVTHVSGSTQFTATWAIFNGGSTAMQAFEGADMYVNGNDNGDGTSSGTTPNRVIGSVASDGTQGQLVERAVSPWTHFFSAMNSQFYDATGDSTFGSLSDTIDPTNQDSGMGVEWDFILGAGQTKTVSVVWSFTHPALPQAPRITGGAPVASTITNATSASPAFAAAIGDGSNSISFACSLDGGAFFACISPNALTGLTDGAHTFSVRALNSAGDPGPQTDRTWTVDTTPPVAPALTGGPTGTVAVDDASITLTGEAGATFRCSVDGGSYVGCSSPLVLTGLADGHHGVSVKQVDTAGNVGTLTGTASWTVDTSVPAAPAADEPQDTTTGTATEVAFTTTPGMTAECSLDGAAWEACASPATVAGLAAGRHEMRVRMVNSAGTAGAERTVAWEVRAAAPASPTPAATTTTKATTSTTTATPAPAARTLVPVRCVSRRSVDVHWALPGAARATSFKVVVDGRVVKTLSGRARAYTLSLAGRAAASVKVQVTAVTTAGRALATTRVYRTCAAKAGRADLPTVVLKAVKA
jgi:hypothetical protein